MSKIVKLMIVLFFIPSLAFAVFCTNCGVKNDDAAKFCSNCGTKVTGGGEPAKYIFIERLYGGAENVTINYYPKYRKEKMFIEKVNNYDITDGLYKYNYKTNIDFNKLKVDGYEINDYVKIKSKKIVLQDKELREDCWIRPWVKKEYLDCVYNYNKYIVFSVFEIPSGAHEFSITKKGVKVWYEGKWQHAEETEEVETKKKIVRSGDNKVFIIGAEYTDIDQYVDEEIKNILEQEAPGFELSSSL